MYQILPFASCKPAENPTRLYKGLFKNYREGEGWGATKRKGKLFLIFNEIKCLCDFMENETEIAGAYTTFQIILTFILPFHFLPFSQTGLYQSL